MAVEQNMYQEAMTAIKQGDKARARDLFTRLLKINPGNSQYWIWMSATVDTNRERVFCLKEALRLDPSSREARHGLIMAGALPPDPSLAIPPNLLKRNWESQIQLSVPSEKLITRDSWKQIALFAGALLLLTAVGVAIFMSINHRNSTVAQVIKPTLGPTPTYVPTQTLVVRSPTPTFIGPTPLWMLLKATYTPTPLYVNTPHPRSEAYRSALRAYQLGKWDNVIQFMKQVLSVDPAAPDIYYYIGEAYRMKKDYKNALTQYNQAIQVDAKFGAVYLGRALAYLASSPPRTGEAVADLQKAISLDPNDAEAYLALAKMDINNQDADAALEHLVPLATLSPNSVFLYYYRSLANLLAGNYDQALQDAVKANQIDATYLPAYRLIGETYVMAGKPAEAVKPLETYLLYVQDDAPATAWLANAYAANQQEELALQTFEKAIQLDPEQADVYLQRGLYYLDRAQTNLAIVDLTQAVGKNRGSLSAQMALGQAYMQAEDFTQAYNRFAAAELLVKSDSHRAAVFYWRAQALEKMDEIVKAIKDWKLLLALPAESVPAEWADTAREHLSSLSTPTNTPISPTPSLTRQPTRTVTLTLTRWPTLTPTPTLTPKPRFTPTPSSP